MGTTKREVETFILPTLLEKKFAAKKNVHVSTENRFTGLPLWKKYLLGIALLVGLAGLILQLVIFSNPQKMTATDSVYSTLPPTMTVRSLDSPSPTLETVLPGTEISQITDNDQNAILGLEIDDWSALLTKVGFSFLVGFVIGYILRLFIKLVLLMSGIVLLTMFGLQYAGYINIDWYSLQIPYDAFIAWLQPHIGNFQEFISSNLPSSSMALVGMLIGFYKRK